jgi:UDP-glucose 4-epimerase
MARILLTGGAGFIGSHVARELVGDGHEVIILDSFVQYVSPFESHYKAFLHKRFEGIRNSVVLERGDTRDKLHLQQLIYRHRPERIVHLAGLPIADLSNKYPDETVSTIVNSTVNILDIIKEVDFVKRFVLISSSMVYGDFQYVPADEEHPKNPKEVYGGTKLAAEILTRAYSQRFGIPYTIIRPSAVYGPTDVNKRVTQNFIFNAFLGKPLLLHDGSTALDFTYVTDAAHGICLATMANAAERETLNVTRGEGRTLREYTEILREHFPDLTIEHSPCELFRPKRGALDISKARSLLGYEPRYCLEDGLAEYVRFLEQNFPPELADCVRKPAPAARPRHREGVHHDSVVHS